MRSPRLWPEPEACAGRHRRNPKGLGQACPRRRGQHCGTHDLETCGPSSELCPRGRGQLSLRGYETEAGGHQDEKALGSSHQGVWREPFTEDTRDPRGLADCPRGPQTSPRILASPDFCSQDTSPGTPTPRKLGRENPSSLRQAEETLDTGPGPAPQLPPSSGPHGRLPAECRKWACRGSPEKTRQEGWIAIRHSPASKLGCPQAL